jgi:hypothetical protein
VRAPARKPEAKVGRTIPAKSLAAVLAAADGDDAWVVEALHCDLQAAPE